MGGDKDKKKMSRKKTEVQLQQDVESQEEWEDMLAKEGVWVVDIYQEWCGPCRSMVSTLRRLKNELGDDMLHFAAAKADTVDALEKYRGRCEPTFLFYAGGVLVSVVRGSNSPLIQRTITEQLAYEHKVVAGNAERKEVKDPLISELANREKSELDEEETEKADLDAQTMEFEGELVNFGDSLAYSSHEGDVKKEVTVAIIKPDAVEAGKADDIIEQMKEAGIEILKQEEKRLTEDEAKEFYSHMSEEDFFEDLVKFMSSGPCIVLVITKGKTGENIIQEWREFIGPTTVEDAKDMAPNSLRAKYGSHKFMNAVHGSDSPDTAARELAFFFPDFAAPKVSTKTKLQRTLALIRPDAFKAHKVDILEKIRESGFRIAMSKEMDLTKDQVEEFYKEHKDQKYFDELIKRMTSGPVLALGLAREDAVAGWRSMLGPTDLGEAKEQDPDSLRAKYSVEGVEINQLHGSDSEDSAEKEIQFFFPMQQTIAAIKPDAYGTKEEIIDKIHEAGFRIAARKETTLSRDIAEEFYADIKDQDYYDDLVEHMSSGPTLFMVLSREDAVEGWREIIGPTDPEKAREECPESIRAVYGNSCLQNAVHGSSNPDHVQKSMEKVFGKLDFNKDGTVKDSSTTSSSSQREINNFSSVPEEDQKEDAIRKEETKESSEAAPEAKEKEEQEKQSSRAASPKSDSPKPSSPKPDSPKAGSRPSSGKDESKQESEKVDSKPSSPKPDSKPSSPKPDSKPSSPKPDSPKADSPKPDSPKADSPRPDSPKKESSSPRPDSPKKEDSTVKKEDSNVEKKESSEENSESTDKKEDDEEKKD